MDKFKYIKSKFVKLNNNYICIDANNFLQFYNLDLDLIYERILYSKQIYLFEVYNDELIILTDLYFYKILSQTRICSYEISYEFNQKSKYYFGFIYTPIKDMVVKFNTKLYGEYVLYYENQIRDLFIFNGEIYLIFEDDKIYDLDITFKYRGIHNYNFKVFNKHLWLYNSKIILILNKKFKEVNRVKKFLFYQIDDNFVISQNHLYNSKCEIIKDIEISNTINKIIKSENEILIISNEITTVLNKYFSVIGYKNEI